MSNSGDHGAYVKSLAALEMSQDPRMDQVDAIRVASQCWDDHDTIVPRPLESDSERTLRTWIPTNTFMPPDLDTTKGQNEFLVAVLRAKGGSMMFGENHVVRTAECTDRPGEVKVSVIVNLRTPINGKTQIKSSYIQRVTRKNRAEYLKPTVFGKIMREIAYPTNDKRRTLSHLIKLVGPKPSYLP